MNIVDSGEMWLQRERQRSGHTGRAEGFELYF